MSKRVASLEEISKDYPIILVDTCVLIGYQNFSGVVNADLSAYNIKVDSANFFKKYIDEGAGIYVTRSVFMEYSIGGSSFPMKDLLSTIQSNSRILEFDEDERKSYNERSRKHSGIKNKFLLGNVDYDLVVSAFVLSEMRKKPVALISNDIGILRAWKFLFMRENLSLDELRFLIRIGNETFKKIKPPKDYKKI